MDQGHTSIVQINRPSHTRLVELNNLHYTPPAIDRDLMLNANVVYKIPADTGILVPRAVLFPNGKGVSMFWDKGFNIKQCIPSKTTREVIYTDEDLGYNPQTKECFGKFSPDIMGPRELDYYVFKLPENSKHIPYIFVPYDDVIVVKNRVGPSGPFTFKT